MDANDVIGRRRLCEELGKSESWVYRATRYDGFPRDVHGLWCWSWVLEWMEQRRAAEEHDLAGRKL